MLADSFCGSETQFSPENTALIDYGVSMKMKVLVREPVIGLIKWLRPKGFGLNHLIKPITGSRTI